MKRDIHIAYSELENDLKNNVKNVGERLYDFAIDYTNDDELRFRCMLLREDINTYAGDELLIQNIIANMDSVAREVYAKALSGDEATPPSYDLDAIQARWKGKKRPRNILFSCKGLTKSYPRSEFRLKDIDLELKEGEITGLVGENGNGKTTLLKIIAGESYPDKGCGSYSYGVLQDNGMRVDWSAVKSQIAYLPQELGRLIGSVKTSIQYAAATHGITGVENDKEVEYIIRRLGLGTYKNAIWQELSGGYKLRFALARTLVWKPRIMVLDEPLANLDINTQIRVLNDLRDLCKSIKYPISIIMSSQNIEEIENASDKMVVLREGEIVYQSPTNHIGDERK